MKKHISIPALLVFAALAVACGKSNKDGATNQPVAAPVATTPPVVTPPSGSNIQSWCWQSGGTFNSANNTCRMSETVRFGWNKYYGSIDTGVMIYPNDTVTIYVDRSHENYVDSTQYPDSFVSQTHGRLVVRGNGFTLRSVTYTRCVDGNFQAVACQ